MLYVKIQMSKIYVKQKLPQRGNTLKSQMSKLKGQKFKVEKFKVAQTFLSVYLCLPQVRMPVLL